MQQTDQVRQLLQTHGIIRPRDLTTRCISRAALYTLLDQGIVIRTGRGLYMLAETDFTEHHALAEVCKRVIKITQWAAFLHRNRLAVDGASFGDIVVALSTFLLSPMQALTQGIPFSQHWAAETQWH